MEIGARLKEAREEKNLSLESLQETTKIQKRYLEAIEQGNFHILPGKFYARAFIKEYASAVGLDSEELLDEYKEEIPQTEAESSTQYTQIHRSRKDNNPTKNTAVFSFIPTIIVILLVIGIAFAAWYFYQQSLSDDGSDPVEPQNDNEVIYNPDENNQDDEQTEDNNKNDKNTENNDEGTEVKGEEPELTLLDEGTGPDQEPTFELKNPGNELVVTFDTGSSQSWFAVENDNGESFYSETLTSEESPMEFDLTGEEKIHFNVGSTPNLQITVNGVELEYPVDPNESDVQSFWITINQTTE